MHVAEKHLVSVVIPTYNHAQFLGKALQSVLDQTYTNWEIIVVDNHSTDHTDEVMSGFLDHRITFLKIHNNGVIAASRNAGIRAAKGEWVAFLDSDDWWAPHKLEVCFRLIDEQVDFVYHDLHIVRTPPSFFKRSRTKGRQVCRPALKDFLLKGNPVATSSVLVRKQFLDGIGGFDERPVMITVEDYHAWMRIAELTENFLYIPRELGYYLFHVSGASRKNTDALISGLSGEFNGNLNAKEQELRMAMTYYVAALNGYYSGRITIARERLLFSMRYGPLTIKIKSLLLYIFSSFIR